jgi:hypothetical protein
LTEDFIEVWSECRIGYSILVEFGEKVNAKEIDPGIRKGGRFGSKPGHFKTITY